MDPWTDRNDINGNPHTSVHRDGHKIGLFNDGWWAYNAQWKRVSFGVYHGPEPEGPFATLTDAKKFVEAQGWHQEMHFERDAS